MARPKGSSKYSAEIVDRICAEIAVTALTLAEGPHCTLCDRSYTAFRAMVSNGATLICDACAEVAALLIGRTLRPRKPHRVQHMVNWCSGHSAGRRRWWNQMASAPFVPRFL